MTPAPGQVAQNQSAIIPGVFPQSCAAFLSDGHADRRRPAKRYYPVLTTNADRCTRQSENAIQATETTGSVSARQRAVRRPDMQASVLSTAREDRARFSGMDEALRMQLVAMRLPMDSTSKF